MSVIIDKKDMIDCYYTPTLDEFYVGFEFEYKDSAWEGREEFQPCIVKDSQTLRFITNLDSIDGLNEMDFEHLLSNVEYEIEHDNIRVKYLDERDIQELGFDYSHSDLTANSTEFFFRPWIGTRDSGKRIQCYTLMWRPTENKIVIQTNEGYSPLIIFNGTIKNKSELNKILKMLNID